jgi:hypothetical protein
MMCVPPFDGLQNIPNSIISFAISKSGEDERK